MASLEFLVAGGASSAGSTQPINRERSSSSRWAQRARPNFDGELRERPQLLPKKRVRIKFVECKCAASCTGRERWKSWFS